MQDTIISIFLFFSTLFLAAVPTSDEVHAFHMSKSTINFDSGEGALQITMNMFIDDLELALEQYGADSLNICTRFEKEEAEDYIYGYILDRLVISIDGFEVTPSFLGKEQSEDLQAVWCYLEVSEVGSFEEMRISNRIMVDLFDDQKNMTSIQIDKLRLEDILFTVKKIEQTVQIDN